MATYTVELSSMIAAYAALEDDRKNKRTVQLKGVTYNNQQYEEMVYRYTQHDYIRMIRPNQLIDDYGSSWFNDHIGEIQHNYTDNEVTNQQINDQVKKTFIRHFYGWEIGQENPLQWEVVARDFFDEFMPLFVQNWKQLVIDQNQWLTNLNELNSESVGTTTDNFSGNVNTNGENSGDAMNGTADTPQNGLEWNLNNADPSKDYNFRYASNVAGSKTHGTEASTTKTSNNDEGKTTSNYNQHSQGRSASVAQLIQQMQVWTNGAYQDLFTSAKLYGLFMQVM